MQAQCCAWLDAGPPCPACIDGSAPQSNPAAASFCTCCNHPKHCWARSRQLTVTSCRWATTAWWSGAHARRSLPTAQRQGPCPPRSPTQRRCRSHQRPRSQSSRRPSRSCQGPPACSLLLCSSRQPSPQVLSSPPRPCLTRRQEVHPRQQARQPLRPPCRVLWAQRVLRACLVQPTQPACPAHPACPVLTYPSHPRLPEGLRHTPSCQGPQGRHPAHRCVPAQQPADRQSSPHQLGLQLLSSPAMSNPEDLLAQPAQHTSLHELHSSSAHACRWPGQEGAPGSEAGGAGASAPWGQPGALCRTACCCRRYALVHAAQAASISFWSCPASLCAQAAAASPKAPAAHAPLSHRLCGCPSMQAPLPATRMATLEPILAHTLATPQPRLQLRRLQPMQQPGRSTTRPCSTTRRTPTLRPTTQPTASTTRSLGRRRRSPPAPRLCQARKLPQGTTQRPTG